MKVFLDAPSSQQTRTVMKKSSLHPVKEGKDFDGVFAASVARRLGGEDPQVHAQLRR